MRYLCYNLVLCKHTLLYNKYIIHIFHKIIIQRLQHKLHHKIWKGMNVSKQTNRGHDAMTPSTFYKSLYVLPNNQKRPENCIIIDEKVLFK